MSSHHIVRDDQEPALLVGQTGLKSDNLLQLLEWSPTVLVTKDALESVTAHGVNIDVVICHQGELPGIREKLHYQMPVSFLVPEAADKNLLERGVRYLSGQKYPAVHIVDSFDHNFFTALSQAHAMLITVWDGDIKWFYCQSGRFTKWVPAHHRFVFIDHHVVVEADADLSFIIESAGTCCEVSAEGFVAIAHEGRPFWLGEYIQ